MHRAPRTLRRAAVLLRQQQRAQQTEASKKVEVFIDDKKVRFSFFFRI